MLANGVSAVEKIAGTGASANRVDVVIVGDGYTTNNLGQYYEDAAFVAEKFLEQQPLKTYRSYFNVHRVDVTSRDSGVANDPAKGIKKDTALKMNFWCSGTERLLCADIQKVKQHAANAPGRDIILALANTTKYGGAGYWKDGVATLSGRNVSSVELAIHEIGHSFALLGDEYSHAGSSSSECAKKENSTTLSVQQMLSAKSKWFRWLDVPHIGSFDGSCYKASGVRRPTQDSKMRTLGQPLYEVNSEQFIFAIYKKVNLIDSATASGSYKKGSVLKIQTLKPEGHSLSIQWYQDDREIAGANQESLDTNLLSFTKSSHKISVKVIDPTTRVRNESQRAKLMTATRSWTVAR